MIRSPQELSENIKSAVNKRAVIFSHLLLALVVSFHTALDPKSNRFEIISAIVIGVILAGLVLFRFFDLAKINNHPRAYIGLYMIVYFFGIAFLTDPATPYALGFFLIVFITNIYYGSKGVWATIGFFGLTSVTKYLYMRTYHDLDFSGTLNIFATFIVFISIASLFISIQKVFDWDRKKMRDALKESALEEKRMRALINNMTESVLVLDKEGIVRLYNAAALALFDTNNSLSDKPLDGFARLEDEKGVGISAQELLPKDSKPLVRSDINIRYKGEDTASLSVTVTPIRAGFGEEQDESGYVMTLRDITREKSLEEERDEFISVISHELRTPVTVAEAGISNSLLLAEKLNTDQKIKDSLKTAHDQSLYLANMLNDLTTFARAEKGTLEMNLESFDPRELLETLKQDYQSAVIVKKMNITTYIDPSTPLRMASNRLYIREILQNFVTNAIKYSDKGTITISARAKENGVLFSVKDEGIGISTSDLKRVFEKFFRAEDYRTRSSSGTGLGLYITKKLAKILDATFEISSEVGKGSTFAVLVPDKTSVLKAKEEAAKQPLPDHHIAPKPSGVTASAALLPKVTTPQSQSPAQTIHSTSTLTPLSPAVTSLATSVSPQPVALPPEQNLPKQG